MKHEPFRLSCRRIFSSNFLFSIMTKFRSFSLLWYSLLCSVDVAHDKVLQMAWQFSISFGVHDYVEWLYWMYAWQKLDVCRIWLQLTLMICPTSRWAMIFVQLLAFFLALPFLNLNQENTFFLNISRCAKPIRKWLTVYKLIHV